MSFFSTDRCSFTFGTDTLARTAIQPIEIPVGMIMTIIGVPFILYLAVKRSGYA
ncbi:MAG: hypothetical protein EF807_00855 [Candidatus Methanolliviera hydrocarbonicum]|uniref:Iron ABC transporter permease n=1 Tax=Candidatus Methanolliviera hydrocarbonicum TaxID=2491085 RepID=A0A520L053_9EURY|nr:MAG: hypothetical protein EF807_00855 [Candidatus Methanolliviera hydrocarbonicum]